MADVHSPATRSYNMSRIKGKNTKPEMIVRRYLFANGFRYRLHVKELPGKPDLVLKRYRTVIFVHRCFWHGHEGCPYFVIPKTRTEWWTGKLNKNRENDEKARNQLIAQGWKVVLIWECELKRFNMNHTLNTLIQNLKVHDADTRN
jgi:DNA mismatch endonuclease, patch repair protein